MKTVSLAGFWPTSVFPLRPERMSIQWHGRVASRKYGLPKLKPYSQTSDTSFAKKVASLVPVLCQVWKATRRASRLPHRWMHRE
eukprot:scaffold71285_cov30-Tisochrysis_lutea.AAC.3